MNPVSSDIKTCIPILIQLGFKIVDIGKILSAKKTLVYLALRLFEVLARPSIDVCRHLPDGFRAKAV
jgi:hypothetical protein